mmetsp:Transcript_2517/g.6280  ORF Transcript_2517/g.6280 Transcript_2517/m.6280 type:complete len:213 (-) Transcript_2517:202-840(-)
MSVAVTHSRPLSETACTALSKNGAGDPYGSRSTTSNAALCASMAKRQSAVRTSMNASRLDSCVIVSGSSRAPRGCPSSLGGRSDTPLSVAFSAIDSAAVGTSSVATMLPTSRTSFAYRIERKPDAAIASMTLIGGGGAASTASIRSFPIDRAASSSKSGVSSSALFLASPAANRDARFAALLVPACHSSSRVRAKHLSAATERSRLFTCALL